MSMKLIALAAASVVAAMPAVAQEALIFRCYSTELAKSYHYRIGPAEFTYWGPAANGRPAGWQENQCTNYSAVCTWEKGVLDLRTTTLLQVFDTNTGVYRMGPPRVGLDTTLQCTRVAAPPQ